MSPCCRAWLLAALLPGAAWAHSLSDELGFGSTQPTANNPRSGYVYDRLSGEARLSEKWDLRTDLILTHDDGTPPQAGSAFGSSGGNIPFIDFGADFDPNEHLSFGAEVDVSPKSTQANDATVTLDTATGASFQGDGDLRSTSSSLGTVLSFGLDTAGESNFETAGVSTLGITHFSSTQQIARVANSTNTSYDLNLARSACRRLRTAGRNPPACAPLLGEPSDVTQGRLSLNLDETLYDDTDVGLSGAYYFYDKDPTTVGYFTVTSAGRGGGYQFGQGLAIAPYLWTLRPHVAHRFFGHLKVDLSYQYGMYWPGQGDSNALALKVELKLNRAWKVWVSVTGERDADGSGNITNSGALAVGTRWRF